MDYQSLIRLPRPNAQAELRLLCFSYAGGNASSYLSWTDQLPANVELAVVQLPGRTTRFREPAYVSMEPLVCDLLEAYQRLSVKPLVLFGHSMGARVAYAFTLALLRLRMILPVHMVVSASPAPTAQQLEQARHTLSDSQFIEMLNDIQGASAESLSNPELRTLMLPILRADFSVIDTYQSHFKGKIPTTVSIFAGRYDRIDRQTLESWSANFSYNTGIHWIEGDHFFIDQNPQAVLSELRQIFERLDHSQLSTDGMAKLG